MPIRRSLAAPLSAVLVTGGLVLGGVVASPASAAATHYKNCTEMHKHYKHGIGRSGARDHVSGSSKPVTTFYRSNTLYAANKASDRDHDGIACEAR